MTAPAQNGTTPNRPPAAPPPNPKVQAVTFALELAKIRSSSMPKQDTTAELLIQDATKIAAYIGEAPRQHPAIGLPGVYRS